MAGQQGALPLPVRFPLKASDLRRGGIGLAEARVDHVASTPTELMFLAGDPVILLALLSGNESEGVYLGQCEHIVGTVRSRSITRLPSLARAPSLEQHQPRSFPSSAFKPPFDPSPLAHPPPSGQDDDGHTHMRSPEEEGVPTPRPRQPSASHSANDSVVDLYRYSATDRSHRDSASDFDIDLDSYQEDPVQTPVPKIRPASIDLRSGSVASQLRRRTVTEPPTSPEQSSPQTTPQSTPKSAPKTSPQQFAMLVQVMDSPPRSDSRPHPLSNGNFAPPAGFSSSRPEASKVAHITVVPRPSKLQADQPTPPLQNSGSSASGSFLNSPASRLPRTPESVDSFESWVYKIAGEAPGTTQFVSNSPTAAPINPVTTPLKLRKSSQYSPPRIVEDHDPVYPTLLSPVQCGFSSPKSPPHMYVSGGMSFESVRPVRQPIPNHDSAPQPDVMKENEERRQFYRRSYCPPTSPPPAPSLSSPPQSPGSSRSPSSPRSEATKIAMKNEQAWIRILSKYNLAQAHKSQYSAMKKLVRLGIPPALRSRVWSFLLNVHAMSEEGLYTKLVMSDLSACAHYSSITAHLEHCYRQEVAFKDRFTPPLQDLLLLLHVFDAYQPALYNHALAYIGRILLLHSPPEDAFWQLVAVSRTLPNTRPDMEAFVYALSKLLEISEPQVAKLLDRNQISASSTWAPLYFRSVLAAILPTKSSLRLFDLYCLDGNHLLARAILAVFDLTRDNLLASGADVRRLLGRPMQDVLDPPSFISTLFTIRLKESALKKFMKQAKMT